VASRSVRPPIAPVGVSFARLLEGRGELLLCKEWTKESFVTAIADDQALHESPGYQVSFYAQSTGIVSRHG
jgi:hypothetical protein